MVFVRLVLLALVASLWEVAEGGVRRVNVNPYNVLPCVAPRAVPRVICSSRRERELEKIISKLISALIVTNLENGSGGSGGNKDGGSSGSDSPLTMASLLDISALGQTLVDIQVLPDSVDSDADLVESLLSLDLGPLL